jgi:DMSO/TMAO reductase YedYZ molybdopterin-dependent catalytic subunit
MDRMKTSPAENRDQAGPYENTFSVKPIDRRRFLIRMKNNLALVMVSGTAVSAVLNCRPAEKISPGKGRRWSEENLLPNADDPVKPVPGTRPELTKTEDHYKMYNNPVPPELSLDEWRLKVHGLVKKPLQLSYSDITQHEPLHEFVTLSCISNPLGGPLISTTRWTGVSLQKLLPLWELKPEATHLIMRSADGFFECIALQTILSDSRVMLVYEWDGVPLPVEHGFPLRIYIPDRYGMKQPKWLVSVEAADHWEPGFSVARTWDREAIMETTSAIDTITPGSADLQTISIGGYAHGGARGISKVEVKINNRDWQQAQLRQPLSSLTWVLWRYDWPFQQGEHTFAVRAYNSAGELQDLEESPPYPDGATGIHQKTKKV